MENGKPTQTEVLWTQERLLTSILTRSHWKSSLNSFFLILNELTPASSKKSEADKDKSTGNVYLQLKHLAKALQWQLYQKKNSNFFSFCYFCNENWTSLTDLHICIISTCHQRTQVTRIALAPCCPAAAKPLGKHPHVLFLQRPNGGAVSLWLSE